MRKLVAFFHTRTGHVVRYGVSVVLLVALASQVDRRTLVETEVRIDGRLVSLAVVLAGLSYPLMAWRWWLLLRAHGARVGQRWVHVVTWIGQFYHSFTPGGLGGDAARAYYVCRDEPERRGGALAAIVIDRVMGLAVLLSITVAALLAKSSALAEHGALRALFILSLAGCAAALAGVIGLLVLPLAHWPGAVRRRVPPQLQEILTGTAGAIRDNLAAHAWALVASYAVWLVDIVAIWLLGRAIGLELPFLDTCVAASVAYAATVLPISIGGHGVREGALLAVLGLFGLVTVTGAGPSEQPALLALLTWAVTVFWSLFGGLFVFFGPPRTPRGGNRN